MSTLQIRAFGHNQFHGIDSVEGMDKKQLAKRIDRIMADANTAHRQRRYHDAEVLRREACAIRRKLVGNAWNKRPMLPSVPAAKPSDLRAIPHITEYPDRLRAKHKEQINHLLQTDRNAAWKFHQHGILG